MPAVPRDFEKELRRRYPHLECRWVDNEWFLNQQVQNRFVLSEIDRRGFRWEYKIIESPQGQYREPGGWVFHDIQRDDMGRDWMHRHARKRFMQSLEQRDGLARRTAARNARFRDRLRHDIKDQAYFAGNQRRVHNRNKLEGVR